MKDQLSSTTKVLYSEHLTVEYNNQSRFLQWFAKVALIPNSLKSHFPLIFLILFSFCSLPMFSLILAHTNDYIPKEKFVAAGASLQFTFGMGAMGGPFLCSIFMGIVGANGFFIFFNI